MGKPGDAAAVDGCHFRHVEPRTYGPDLCQDHLVYHYAGRWAVANKSLVDFGTTLEIWIANATRYRTVASDVRPWPWSELA